MVELKDVSVHYDHQIILKNVDLTLSPGEHAAVMGPSGCGKTTLLRVIAGLASSAAGDVAVRTKHISFLFQEPRLFPWLTAQENVNIVISNRRSSFSEAGNWLAAVGLSDALSKYPAELSGGMQQRVSLARALAYNGDLFLLDEPLKGLDTQTKEDMLRLLYTHTAGKTLLLATHDETEAKALGCTLYSFQDHTFKRI